MTSTCKYFCILSSQSIEEEELERVLEACEMVSDVQLLVHVPYVHVFAFTM